MKRTKVVIWGISDPILNAIENTVNLYAVDIKFFIDANPYKQGLKFHGIPIYGINAIEETIENPFEDIDYILISAYRGISDILNQLSDFKLRKTKVAPLLTDRMCGYILGDIDKMQWRDTLSLYYQPEMMREIAEEYLSLYKNYLSLEKNRDKQTAWYHNRHLISHACGGIIDEYCQAPYTNSRKALMNTLENGYKLVECDIIRVADGQWWLGHNFSMLSRFKAHNDYVPFALEDFFEIIEKHLIEKKLTILIDIKWKTHEEYLEAVDYIEDYIKCHPKGLELKQSIVLEAYDEDTIQYAHKFGYQMIFTQYRNPEGYKYMKTAYLCKKYGIDAIALSIATAKRDAKLLKQITDKGIDYFVFSTDSVDDYCEIRRAGGYGIFSNQIIPCE